MNAIMFGMQNPSRVNACGTTQRGYAKFLWREHEIGTLGFLSWQKDIANSRDKLKTHAGRRANIYFELDGSFRDPMFNGRIKTGDTKELSLQAAGVRFLQARTQLNQSIDKSVQNTA